MKGTLVHSGVTHTGLRVATWIGEWWRHNPYTGRPFRACRCDVVDEETYQLVQFHTGLSALAADHVMPFGVCMVLEEQPA